MKPTLSAVLLIALLMLTAFASTSSAQECVTGRNTSVNYFSPPAPFTVNPSCMLNIPIVLQVVRKADGSNGISAQDALDAFDYFNEKFASTNIQFYHLDPNDPVRFIDDSYYNPMSEGLRLNLSSTYHVNGGINIYFVARHPSETWAGIAYVPDVDLIINNPSRQTSPIIHEMGHCLGLWHTHGGMDENGSPLPQELVDGSNCNTAGDLICDTRAEPYNNDLGILGKVYGTPSCQYFGNEVDPNNDPYDPNTDNFLSYAPDGCRTTFTAGQITRMRETIILDRFNILSTLTVQFSNRIDGNIHYEGDINVYQDAQLIATVPSGDTYDLKGCVDYLERTNQERLPLSTPTKKHKDWNEQATSFKLYNDFSPNPDYQSTLNQRANYVDMSPVTLLNDFEGTGTDGNLLFRDPWHEQSAYQQPNTHRTVSSPHEPTGSYNHASGGVFINVDIISGRPYYSLQAFNYLDATNKQTRGLPLPAGDWALTGVFSETAGEAIMTDDPQFGNYTYAHPFFYRSEKFTKAIEFKQTDATITAAYKAHLLSTGPQNPTRLNSQRKVALLDPAYPNVGIQRMHLAVYESSNKVYFMYSTDDGYTWSPEELVSDYHASSSRPSIAVSQWDSYDDGALIYVAYLEGNEVVVKYKEIDGFFNIGWTEIDRQTTTVPEICHPSVVASRSKWLCTPHCVVVWEDDKTLKYSIFREAAPLYAYDTRTQQYLTFLGVTFREGRIQWNQVQRQPQYPSIAYDIASASHPRFGITWNEEIGYLGYDDFEIDNTGSPVVENYIPAEIVQATFGRSIDNNAAPSLTAFGNPIVTYSWTNLPTRYPSSTAIGHTPMSFGSRLLYNVVSPFPMSFSYPCFTESRVSIKMRSATMGYYGSWLSESIVVTGACEDLTSPSVGALDWSYWNTFGRLRVAMNKAGSGIAIAQIDGGLPPTLFPISQTDGYDPNLNATGKLVELYSTNLSGGGALSYMINAETAYLNKTSTITAPPMRELVVNKDSSIALFGICMPKVVRAQGTSVALVWAAPPDSLEEGQVYSVADRMKTLPFSVMNGDSLVFATEVFARYIEGLGDPLTFNLTFMNAQTDDTVMVDAFDIADFPSDTSIYALYKLDISPCANQEVVLALTLSRYDESHQIEVVNVYYMETSMEKPDPVVESKATPTLVTLSHHPNPFNPSAEVTFFLPESGEAHLVVLNPLGQEVATLSTGVHSSGYHTYTFDAGGFPSGVYIARLTVNGVVITRKMTLLK